MARREELIPLAEAERANIEELEARVQVLYAEGQALADALEPVRFSLRQSTRWLAGLGPYLMM